MCSTVCSAPSRVRFPYPFQWGYPIFFFQDCLAMMAAAFVSLVEVCSLCNHHVIEFFYFQQQGTHILVNTAFHL